MAHDLPGPPWPPMASCWEDLFPLRPARVRMALDWSREGQRTLDAGCATGSLVRALARQGRQAEGLDLEPTLLVVARDRARAEGLELVWHQLNLLEMERVGGVGQFALITCMGQTLPHLLEEREWQECFRQMKTLLATGGHLILQVMNDGGAPQAEPRELPLIQAPGGILRRWRSLLSPELACLETQFTPTGGMPVQSRVLHRRMEPGRTSLLLAQAGLHTRAIWGNEGGVPFTQDSGSWILLAES